MNNKLALACLLGLSFGLFAMPAQANWFDDHDRNHDGKWDRKEYYEWCKHHDHHCPPANELDRRYDKFDRDHNGYLTREEARHFGR
jgi:Ca2+-binding EF-hand superfamily protein